MRTFLATLAVLVLAISAVTRLTPAEDKSQPKKPIVPTSSFSLFDLGGTNHSLDQNDGRRVRAFVFLSTEYPVSNG